MEGSDEHRGGFRPAVGPLKKRLRVSAGSGADSPGGSRRSLTPTPSPGHEQQTPEGETTAQCRVRGLQELEGAWVGSSPAASAQRSAPPRTVTTPSNPSRPLCESTSWHHSRP